MCIIAVLLTLTAREWEAQGVANNYRSRLVFCLVSIAVASERQPYSKQGGSWLFGFERLVCTKCLVRSLAFACTSLLPTFYHRPLGLARPPCSQAHLQIQRVKRFLCSYPSWTVNRHAATGVGLPNYCLTDGVLRALP